MFCNGYGNHSSVLRALYCLRNVKCITIQLKIIKLPDLSRKIQLNIIYLRYHRHISGLSYLGVGEAEAVNFSHRGLNRIVSCVSKGLLHFPKISIGVAVLSAPPPPSWIRHSWVFGYDRILYRPRFFRRQYIERMRVQSEGVLIKILK